MSVTTTTWKTRPSEALWTRLARSTGRKTVIEPRKRLARALQAFHGLEYLPAVPPADQCPQSVFERRAIVDAVARIPGMNLSPKVDELSAQLRNGRVNGRDTAPVLMLNLLMHVDLT